MDTIRKAQLEDSEKIRNIQNSYNYHGRSIEDLAEKGFFVHLLSQEEIGDKLRDPESYSIVNVSDDLDAYLIGFIRNAGKIKDDIVNKTDYLNSDMRKKLEGEGYGHINYIGRNSRASPYAPILLERFFLREVKKRNIGHAIGIISLDPFNKKSYDFHIRLGFEQIGTINETYQGDKFIWATMYRALY